MRIHATLLIHAVTERAAEQVAIVVMATHTAALDVCLTAMQPPSASNCVLDPKPLGGAAAVDVLSNKVIGYYESWMARKDCHKVAPTDLPCTIS
ncbi:uncharacterized protein N7529_007366 [Penicillium soppii]|uniref:uncharacterized protein n=1 Tax=Penicillium soppii TaxID=69789 RepID=UPI0025486B63|nr:uncharacterized protein N7529_007366 [Penicillium soppii]KAJ5860056.1 hypothetical protein N7529_007366 [Penicillium soppii]